MKFEDFTRLYPLSKTLRFELKPIGKTEENIQKRGLVEQDEKRADDYKYVKKIIDRYHKEYIERRLDGFMLKLEDNGHRDSLSELYELKYRKDDESKKEYKVVLSKLRKQIADRLKGSDEYKRIFSEDLIKKDLLEFVEENDKIKIESFKNFTTYFTGFYENRKNMYSDEEKSTSISYRLINENLPKFIENIEAYKKIVSVPELKEKMSILYSDLEEYLNVCTIDELFEIGYYNMVLTQKQITIYNSIIGGKSDGENKIQGINEYVNLYNQQNKGEKLPKLKFLYKQILSDKESVSWLPESFKTDLELLSAVKSFSEEIAPVIQNAKLLLENIHENNLSCIYIKNGEHIKTISNRICGNWYFIENVKIENLKKIIKQKKKEDNESYENRLREGFKKIDSFSIEELNDLLGDKHVENYFIQIAEIEEEFNSENIFVNVEKAFNNVRTLLENEYSETYKLCQDKNSITLLKHYLDSLKKLQHFISPLNGSGNENDKDEQFYGEFNLIWDNLNLLTPLYNKVRNYLTQKPYSVNKIKLNFESPQLLGGWDENKESDYLSVILRKADKYYLGIMNKKHNKILKKDVIPNDGDCYEKMVYKAIATPCGVGGFIRKCYEVVQKYGWNCPEYCLNAEGKIIIKDDEAKDKLVDIINCQKDFFDKYEKDGFKYKNYNFKFRNSEDYEKLSEFYDDVKQQAYKITFNKVSVSYIEKLVEEGKLYLFQIWNKDFSEYSKGTPNLHTLYWKMLFDESNLSDVVYQLNGEAEMFFRKKSIMTNKPTHPANVPIKNKNINNQKKESVFEYDLIKNKRYAQNKYLFHVPITLNFKSKGREDINKVVLEYLKESDDFHVIGIDRGERNLLYVVVVDKLGHIKEQISLNEICQTNYHDLLDKRESERQESRESWQSIEQIKDLKEGYLSQVIHRISQLMIKYKAIVVLEDLNGEFIRGRQKVEKQVYQKFEKMLIDKLNYLVDKKVDKEKSGGLLNAYQLTRKFESFTKLGKQSGFLFYVPAWNTSKIDPSTGFVNLLNIKYENIEKSKLFFSKFNSIRYNAEKDWFEFDLDYSNFGNKAEGTRTKWIICTYGTRIESFRNKDKNSQWDYREIDLTQEYKEFFKSKGIDYSENLKMKILNQTEKDFYERMLHLLKLTLQMRNSKSGTDVDYIISPIMNESGVFFDSRIGDDSLPKDADANGAYNIARKGLMMINQIKLSVDINKLKFDLSNKKWLEFAQNKTM